MSVDRGMVVRARRQVTRAVRARDRDAFVAEIEDQCARYAIAGVAAIARLHPPAGGVPGRSLVYVGEPPTHFLGEWRGAPIAVTLMWVGSRRLSWRPPDRASIQSLWLARWTERGNVGVLLLRYSPDAAYVVADPFVIQSLALGIECNLRAPKPKGRPRRDRPGPPPTAATFPVVRRRALEGAQASGWDFLAEVDHARRAD